MNIITCNKTKVTPHVPKHGDIYFQTGGNNNERTYYYMVMSKTQIVDLSEGYIYRMSDFSNLKYLSDNNNIRIS